jgi:transposase
MIHLWVRRFFCGSKTCVRKTFVEQVPGLTTRHGRRTNGLMDALRAVALALGGRAGARLAGRLATGVSRMTLIRLIRALPDPTVAVAPEVLGVDEFALRRGHSYGTVLIDVQGRRPVDVLAERSADSFAAWLADHPGTNVICRDRAGCYADGGSRSAPLAIQVADRWHLWHNLGENVERAVAQHRRCLRVATTPRTSGVQQAEPAPARLAAPAEAGRPRTGRIAERTRQRHAAIHARLAEGSSVRAITAELGLARNTVRRFARAADPEELLVNDGTGRRRSMLEDYTPYLRQRWNEGCTDAAALWRELRARGYPGGYSRVRDYLLPFRTMASAPAPAPQPPKVRQVTAWIMTEPSHRSRDSERQLTTITASCPELAAVQASVQAFAQLMTERRGHDLEKWMIAASRLPELQSFVVGLRRDQDAVTAGLTLPWSSGVVEGHINRIKMLKRQMYGRANPDLLRRRILLAN